MNTPKLNGEAMAFWNSLEMRGDKAAWKWLCQAFMEAGRPLTIDEVKTELESYRKFQGNQPGSKETVAQSAIITELKPRGPKPQNERESRDSRKELREMRATLPAKNPPHKPVNGHEHPNQSHPQVVDRELNCTFPDCNEKAVTDRPSAFIIQVTEDECEAHRLCAFHMEVVSAAYRNLPREEKKTEGVKTDEKKERNKLQFIEWSVATARGAHMNRWAAAMKIASQLAQRCISPSDEDRKKSSEIHEERKRLAEEARKAAEAERIAREHQLSLDEAKVLVEPVPDSVTTSESIDATTAEPTLH